jgi:CRP-like cAMP-binding protein
MDVCLWQTALPRLCWDADLLAPIPIPELRVANVEVTQNQLLQQLAKCDRAVYERLFEDLQPMPLERGALLGVARERHDWVYFVDSGVVSLVAGTSTGRSLEVAIVGREGVAGFTDALGNHRVPYRLTVQLPGLAYRVRTALIRQHIFSCTALHDLLMAYSQFLMHQLSQSAVCSRFHSSIQRLSRWLLLTSERAGTNRLQLTHEFVAEMVGAPRSAVTQAAAELRSQGIIEYRRGLITIRSVKRLHKKSCECFDAISSAMRGGTRQAERSSR